MTPRPLLPGLLLLAACGGGDPGALGAPPDEQYRASATVLESLDHGPELCLGGQADSYPPQCGGVPITNWDWDAVDDDEESANGTTWGAYSVVGRLDGASLTLTQPPRPLDRSDPGPIPEPLASPCEEPEPPAGLHPAASTVWAPPPSWRAPSPTTPACG